MDSIPILSQVKSLVQLIDGDEEGAKQTQENFSRRCIGVSQVRSLLDDDDEAALATQKEFLGEINGMVNGIPAVGHLKGGIHYAFGDTEGGNAAMKESSRTTGTSIGGVCGFVAAGPVGAFAGGVAGALAADCIITGINIAVDGEDKAEGYGTVGLIRDIIENDKKAGSVVDMVGTVLFDGLTGVTAGEAYGRRTNVKVKITDDIKQQINNPEAWNLLEKNANEMKGNTLRNMPKDVENLGMETKIIESQTGLSKRKRKIQIRDATKDTMHTESNFHLLTKDEHLKGHIAADVKSTANCPRGAVRLILKDDNRNYTLNAKAYTAEHYTNVSVPTPNRVAAAVRTPFNAYADLSGVSHIGVEIAARAVSHSHKTQKMKRH